MFNVSCTQAAKRSLHAYRCNKCKIGVHHIVTTDKQVNLRTRKSCWNTQQPADLSVSRHVCCDYLKKRKGSDLFAEVTQYYCTFGKTLRKTPSHLLSLNAILWKLWYNIKLPWKCRVAKTSEGERSRRMRRRRMRQLEKSGKVVHLNSSAWTKMLASC